MITFFRLVVSWLRVGLGVDTLQIGPAELEYSRLNIRTQVTHYKPAVDRVTDEGWSKNESVSE
jgi:hypothetical protein